MTLFSSDSVELRRLPEIPLAVLEHHGALSELPATIARFIAWRKSQQLSPSVSRTFNLFYAPSNSETDVHRIDLGCEISHKVTEPNSEGLLNISIPAGLYAVLRLHGSDSVIESAAHYLYETWLPTTSYRVADFPLFLERVQMAQADDASTQINDLFLPLRG